MGHLDLCPRGFRLAFLLLAIALPARATAESKLVFFDLLLPGNAGVSFKSQPIRSVAADEVDLSQATWAEAGAARVYVDANLTRWDRVGGLFALRYAAYVRTEAQPTRLSLWEVRGETRGVFEDQMADVAFELREPGEGGASSKGTLRLKVGSSEPPTDALVLDAPTLDVSLSGGTAPVVLKARRPGVGLLIRRMRVSPVDPLWRTPPRWVGSGEVTVSDGQGVVIPLETFPSLASAVDWALRRGGTAGTLPRLVAQFDFSTQLFDDRPRTQNIEIPFRFVPSLLHVALALVLGAVLGAALRTALAWRGGRSGVRSAARRVVVGVLGALVAGLIGGLLVTHDSRFVILGFDLNPLELLPAIVLGILCGFATEKVLVAAGLLKQEA